MMSSLEITNTPSSKATSDLQKPESTTESGAINEKIAPLPGIPIPMRSGDEEEEEDMDALIDELESHDGHEDDDESDDQDVMNNAVRTVPESFLATDTRLGLTEVEVLARRKKFGWNQMKEEKKNLVLKFLGYFIGPIQFVMEVRVLLYIAVMKIEGGLGPILSRSCN